MTREIIEKLPKLKYIGELATGYNNIDLQAAKEHGIIVSNIPAYSTDSVAQFVFAHLLNVATHVDYYANSTRKGVWSSKKSFCYWDEPLIELAGKTCLLYTSDAADELDGVDLGGRRIIKKKKNKK